MDNFWVIFIMWFSGWYYFGKLRDRIEKLESQINNQKVESSEFD